MLTKIVDEVDDVIRGTVEDFEIDHILVQSSFEVHQLNERYNRDYSYYYYNESFTRLYGMYDCDLDSYVYFVTKL